MVTHWPHIIYDGCSFFRKIIIIILTPLCMVFPMTCEWNSESSLFFLNTLNSHQLLCFPNCINTWNRGSSNKLLSGLLSMLLHLQEWEYHQFVGFFYMDHQGARRLHLLRLLLMLLKLLFSPWGNFDLSLLMCSCQLQSDKHASYYAFEHLIERNM